MTHAAPQPPDPTPALITDPAQAELLLERVNQEILGALLKKPCRSASELAQQLERPLKTVLYRLERLQEVGLVQLEGERKRGGRAVKLYGPTSHTGWRFPFLLTSAATVQDLLEAQILPDLRQLLGHMAHKLREEMWLFFEQLDGGKVGASFRPPSGQYGADFADTTGGMGTLRLTPQEALELNGKLRELYFEWIQRPESGAGKPYMIGVFMVPVSPEHP